MPNYPATLTITISNERSGETVPEVAVIVTFFASKKNDYHIPRITNTDGEIPLTIDEVRQSIDRDQKLFLMDYASTLEECSQEIEIEVCDTEQIKRTVEAMKMYKDVTDIDENLVNGFKKSVNDRFSVPVVHRFEVNRNIDNVQIAIKPLEAPPIPRSMGGDSRN
jgi:hypothetical protein